MTSPIKNYLRTHRKRSGLLQSDVAFLLGFNSGHVVSRHERLERTTNLDMAFAYQVLFDALPHELYPGLYEKVEKLIRRRIHLLVEELEQATMNVNTAYRRDVLLAIIERVNERRPCV